MKYVYLSALVAAALLPFPLTASAANHDVTIVVPDPLSNLDPCSMSRAGIGRVLKQNVSETLTDVDLENGAAVAKLASKWEPVDDKTWRFELRKGVKFHNGADFKAEDVAHSIKRTLSPDIYCTSGQKYFGGMKLDTKIVDDHTIEITTTPPQPNLPALLSHLAIVPVTTELNVQERNAIGTGPYFISQAVPGQKIELSRFTDYWGEKPVVDKATYVTRADTSVAAAMVATGEADLAPYIASTDVSNAETDFSYPNTETGALVITTNVSPLDDIRVRKAINHAIDREAFIGTILGKDDQVASQLVLPFNLGYNDDLKPFSYDPELARKLLAEAKADGVPVDKEIIFYGRPGHLANLSDFMTGVSQMLQAVGLNVKMQVVEPAQFAKMLAKPHLGPNERQAAIFLQLHDNSSGDAGISLFYKYHSDGVHSEVKDPEVDALINRGLASSGEERRKAFQAAFARVQQDVTPDAVLFHFVGYARVSPKLDWKPSVLTNAELPISTIKFKN